MDGPLSNLNRKEKLDYLFRFLPIEFLKQETILEINAHGFCGTCSLSGPFILEVYHLPECRQWYI